MKYRILLSKFIFMALLCLNVLDVHADQEAYADKDWKVRVGAGALVAPAFLGSDDYQFKVVPDLRFAYQDKFFASLPEGVGYNVIHDNGWRIGPLAKVKFGREEDGDSAFLVGGSETTALTGLGDIDTTFELGGFAEYSWNNLSTKLELRQGINGHEGFVADISLDYKKDISGVFYESGRPIIFKVGPRATLVDGSYNEAYFGVTAEQSSRSGLPVYTAGGGLLSYGVGAATIIPLNRNLSAVLLAGYDRLTEDAADSPLVRQRGSKNQAMIGIFLSYNF